MEMSISQKKLVLARRTRKYLYAHVRESPLLFTLFPLSSSTMVRFVDVCITFYCSSFNNGDNIYNTLKMDRVPK